MGGGQMPTQITNDESFIINLMDAMSGLTPALQGGTERSGESGVLYTRKVIEGSIQQKIPQEFLMEHEHQKMRAWLKLVPKVYGGPVNMNRGFPLPGGKQVIVNELVGYDENGEPILKNDLRRAKDVHIIIGKTNESDFAKQAKRETDITMLRSMQPSATNQEIIATIENNLVMNMDFTSEEEKARTKEAIERRRLLDELNTKAQIAALKGQIYGATINNIKAKAQLQDIGALEDVAIAQAEIEAAGAQIKAKQAYDSLSNIDNPQAQQQQAMQPGQPEQPGQPGGQGGQGAAEALQALMGGAMPGGQQPTPPQQ